jgi:hypothetical protein
MSARDREIRWDGLVRIGCEHVNSSDLEGKKMQEKRGARQGGDTFAESTNILSSIVVIKPLFNGSLAWWHCATGKKECTIVICLTEPGKHAKKSKKNITVPSEGPRIIVVKA